jgi:hypothetical protein
MNLATSTKKNETARIEEIEAGKRRQDEIRQLLTGSRGRMAQSFIRIARRFSPICAIWIVLRVSD